MATVEPKFGTATRAFISGCAAAVSAGLLANTGIPAVAIAGGFVIGTVVGLWPLKDRKTFWPELGALIGAQVGWGALGI